ncbi:MAG TPA: isoprenylcysteine carboxylmethyltransferase family protein [Candidatus Hydrogenedentes bacterium]|nr:isoprenylcysteine carboxylmethyltransferase family protein [Candidatus Hydrogenedentota bacterium]
MLLQTEFQKSGEWLFRWRSYLPLVLLGITLIAMPGYRHPGGNEIESGLWEILCLAVSLLGLGIRVFTIGHVPKRTSGRNTKQQVADILNTSGAYSIVRNPLYLGNFFMGLGVAMFACFWWLALIYALSFWLYYERIIYAEEAYLLEKFGDEYAQWANRTPAFIPDFRLYTPPDLPFSTRTVLRREFNGFFAVILIMFLLEVVGDMFIAKEIFVKIDLSWIVVLAVGFITWAILRTLKKHTKFLHVEGR